MKKFLVGFLTGILVVGVSVSALAASSNALPISGPMTIKVDPIHIQVNGVTFQPTDVNGKTVPVFAYNGTTYASLRALAEAYGLTVGYDAETNMATVTDPAAQPAEEPVDVTDYSNWSAEDEAAYQEFKAMWDIKFLQYDKEDSGIEHAYFDAMCIDPDFSGKDLESLHESQTIFFDRLGFELLEKENTPWLNIFFKTENGGWVHHSVHK